MLYEIEELNPTPPMAFFVGTTDTNQCGDSELLVFTFLPAEESSFIVNPLFLRPQRSCPIRGLIDGIYMDDTYPIGADQKPHSVHFALFYPLKKSYGMAARRCLYTYPDCSLATRHQVRGGRMQSTIWSGYITTAPRPSCHK